MQRSRVAIGIGIVLALVLVWFAVGRSANRAAPDATTAPSSSSDADRTDGPRTSGGPHRTGDASPIPEAAARRPSGGDVARDFEDVLGLHGIVVDERGRPVEDAAVSVVAQPPGEVRRGMWHLLDEPFPQPHHAPTARSGADGRFDVAPLPAGTYRLVVAGGGGATWVSDRVAVGTSGESLGLRAVLEPGVELSGFVRGTDGSRLAGVQVAVAPVHRVFDVDPVASRFATTDADGRFLLTGLRRGVWRLLATRDGESIVGDPLRVELPIPRLFPVIVEGATSLSGTVLGPDGAPVPGARVTWSSRDDWASTTTDDRGRYTLRSLSNGEAKLHVLAEGFAAAAERRRGGRVSFGISVSAYVGENELDVELERGSTLRGRVVDGATGDPVEAVHVSLPYPDRADGWPTAMTDADGRFRLSDVSRGTWTVRARKTGWGQDAAPESNEGKRGRSGLVEIPADGEPDELTISLYRSAFVRGRVVDAGGRPMADVRLYSSRDPSDESGLPGIDEAQFEGPPVRTSAEGHSLIEVAGASSQVELAAFADGFSPHVRVVGATERSGATDVEIRLVRGATIRGRVVESATGNGVAESIVSLTAGERRFDITRTGVDGTFFFEQVQPGRVRLDLMSEARLFEPVALVVQPGETVDGIEIDLFEPASISGRVLRADGRPDGAVEILVQRADGSLRTRFGGSTVGAIVKNNGTFEVSGLLPGTYRLAPQHRLVDVRGAFVEASTGSRDVELRLPELPAVRGRVVFADGSAVESFEVSIESSVSIGNSFPRVAPTVEYGANGAFLILGKRPDPRDLIVQRTAGGEPFCSRRIESVSLDSGFLLIEVERGRSVSGRVDVPAGLEPPDGEVLCVPETGGTSADSWVRGRVVGGHLEIDGLAPIPYRIVLELDGYARTFHRVGPATSDVVVQAWPAATVRGRVVGLPRDVETAVRVSIDDGRRQGGTTTSCDVGRDGTFVLDRVGPGEHVIKARSWNGDVAFEGEVRGVRVAAGATLEDVEIQLRPAK